MDFLNRGLKQVTDLFQTMTPAARLTTGLLLAVLAVSFAYLFRQNVEGGGEYLFGAQTLSDSELAMMEGAFAAAGLEHGRRDGNRIRVPAGESAKYLAALSAADAMPEDSSTAFEAMFKNSSLMDSRQMLDRRERHASEQSLERTIRNLSGVHSATVRIQEIDKGGVPRRKVRTAVATVKAVGTKHLDRDLINTIRDIVAGTSGAEREQVTVADSNANLSYRGSGENGLPLADEDPYAARVRLYESSTKRSIENMLTMYPGALVEVRAELGRDFVNRVDSYTYDAQPVTVKQTSTTKLDTSNNASNGGHPGAASNGLGNTPKQVGGAVANNENKSEETHEQTEAVPGATQTTIQKFGLVPERVTASIRIPRSLFRTIWVAENPPAEGEDPVEPDKNQLTAIELRETQAIKDVVTALLPPPPPGDDPYPLVTVLPYTSTPIEAPPETSLASNAGHWFASNWQTLALFAAAIFSVFFLRGMIQSNHHAPPSSAAADPLDAPSVQHGADDEDDELDLANSLKGRFQRPGRSLRDELTELVHEDPDAAASVLANWIGDAA